ncbi:MAG TPA: hypothetical protein DCZ76_08935 [Treponema sp.]|nr:hypothetical protein [Treponema sp.]
MKNKFHAFLYFTATVLLLLNISSCSGIASPSEQESPSASRGLSLRGRFSLAEASAVPSEYQTATNAALQASRNAIPDTSTLTYSVSATNASNGNIVWATNANSTSYEFNGNLTAGTWEITAYAKQGTALVLQSEPKTVTLSKLAMDASASLTMAPSTSGSGSIDLAINWASDSGIGYCNYSKPDGITITTTSGQPDKITASNIASGIYTVTLSFYTSQAYYNSGAAPLYKCTEYIAVYPGLETNTWTKETAPHIDASGDFNVAKSCVETFVYRKIYVEQGASSSNANGTSERPYPSIESAMTRLSEVAGANIITGISATNPWELHVKGTLKAHSGIGQDFINVPSSVGHLAIIGEGSGATIDADNKCRVLNVASGASVTVENITLKNGSATTGGGVYVANGGTFTMQSGTISSCYASGAGGGIYSEGTLSIQGGYINSNTVTAGTGTGGGIQVVGGSVSVAATGVTIKSNSCGGNGKNIYISSSATATIPTGDSAIYDDSTGTGGKADAICYASGNNFARFNKAHSTQNAIDSVISQFTGDATIYLGMTTSGDTSWNSTTDIASACTQNLTIRPTKTGTKATIKYSASAETTDYLIRFNKSGKTLTLTNLILDGNSKKCGVAKLEAGKLNATNCTFQYGKSENGGGLYVKAGASATLSSCTIQYCRAERSGTSSAYGGGIYTKGIVEFSGTITNCTVKGNGGGVLVETTTNAKFTMTSGTIQSCSAEKSYPSSTTDGKGGGVWSYQTFNMTGGTITGCTSENDGAGVFLGSADSSTPVLIMSGNACIDSNNEVYVGTYKIKIADSLTASKAATISPSSYSTTTQVLTDDSSGSLVNANFRKFSVTPELSDGKTIVWATLSNGKLSATTITLSKETLPGFEPISSIDYDITVDETFDGSDVSTLIGKLNDTVGNGTVLDLSRANVTNMDYWIRGGLSSITFPDCCNRIDSQTFQSATDLKEIKISNSNTTFCTVDGVLYSKDKKKLLQYPAAKEGSTFTLPSTVDTLGYGAFERNKYLETINGLTQIKHLESMVTFNSTLKLKEVDLSGLTDTTLNAYTFQYSTGIEKVTLSSSTQYISFGCFRGLTNLKEVHFKTTTPPPLDASDNHASYRNFKECPNVKFYVPSSAVNAYKNATGERGFSNPEYNGAASTTAGIQAKIFGE